MPDLEYKMAKLTISTIFIKNEDAIKGDDVAREAKMLTKQRTKCWKRWKNLVWLNNVCRGQKGLQALTSRALLTIMS